MEEISSSPSTDMVLPNYAEILVIRHGETEWNAAGRMQGQLDVDLNDAGRQQAILVAERLSREEHKISAVYSSDLKRAFETASMIAQSCGLLEVIKDLNLRERHLGDLQGAIYKDISKLNPKSYKALISKQKDQEIPGGGESFNQLYTRSTDSLQRIAGRHQGERIVVVSHGAAIRALYSRVYGEGKSAGNIKNTSINVFHISNEGKWSIKSWGDVTHLKKIGFLKSAFGGDGKSG